MESANQPEKKLSGEVSKVEKEQAAEPETQISNDTKAQGRSAYFLHFNFKVNDDAKKVIALHNYMDSNMTAIYKDHPYRPSREAISFWFSLFNTIDNVTNYNIQTGVYDFDEKRSISFIKDIITWISEYEGQIMSFFGSNLSKVISKKLQISSEQIAFRVLNLSYGSLDLLIDVIDPKCVVEKFATLDNLIRFLELYSPNAICDCVGFPFPSVIEATVVPSHALIQHFDLNETPIIGSNGSSPPDRKLTYLVNLVRFAWVLPVLIAILLLYFAYINLRDDRKFYLENYKFILEQQRSLIKDQMEANKNVPNAEGESKKDSIN